MDISTWLYFFFLVFFIYLFFFCFFYSHTSTKRLNQKPFSKIHRWPNEICILQVRRLCCRFSSCFLSFQSFVNVPILPIIPSLYLVSRLAPVFLFTFDIYIYPSSSANTHVKHTYVNSFLKIFSTVSVLEQEKEIHIKFI